jgi:hypothetical protein
MELLLGRLLPFGVAVWLLFVAATACHRRPPAVQLWPNSVSRRSPSDLPVDESTQIQALRSARPEVDAALALSRGDARFISDTSYVPRPQGVPDDAIVTSSWQKNGWKIIACSPQMAESEEFRKLAYAYIEGYNRALYRLLSHARGSPPKSGATP